MNTIASSIKAKSIIPKVIPRALKKAAKRIQRFGQDHPRLSTAARIAILAAPIMVLQEISPSFEENVLGGGFFGLPQGALAGYGLHRMIANISQGVQAGQTYASQIRRHVNVGFFILGLYWPIMYGVGSLANRLINKVRG